MKEWVWIVSLQVRECGVTVDMCGDVFRLKQKSEKEYEELNNLKKKKD